MIEIRADSAVLRTPFSRSGKPRYGLSTLEPGNRLAGHQPSLMREMTVTTCPLDQFGFANVGFIKIDVEGHEMSVLRGAHDTLQRERPNILIEAQEKHNPGSVERVRQWFAELGYEGYFLRDRRLTPIAEFDLEVDQQRDGIENFIFVPAERSDEIGWELRELVRVRLGACPSGGTGVDQNLSMVLRHG